MARQERWLRTEAPVRQNWPKIEGPIDNYGEDWGVLVPLMERFTVDPEDSPLGLICLLGCYPIPPQEVRRTWLSPLRLRAVMTWGRTTRYGKKMTVTVRSFLPNRMS